MTQAIAPRAAFASPTDIALLTMTTTPAWVIDLARRQVWWANASGARFLGAAAPGELVGAPYAADDDAALARLFEAFHNTRPGFPTADLWSFMVKGRAFEVKLALTPIALEADARPGLYAECIDENVLASADQSALRLLEAARHAPLMVRMFSAEGDLLSQNAAAAGAYGRLDSEGAPRRLAESFADIAEAAPILSALTRGEEIEREAPMRTRLGPRWHLLTARFGRDPVSGVGAIILSETDVDAEVDARRRMRHWALELERQVEERTEALERITLEARAAKAEAERADRVKSNFLAGMSHELRTPLNAIIGFSELLTQTDGLGRGIAGGLGASHGSALAGSRHGRGIADDFVSNIHRAARHLLDLIEQMLDLAKIESGSRELVESTLDLEDHLEGAVAIVRGAPYGADKRFTVRVEPEDLGLFADARAVKQVLLNLVSNAAKFSPKGGVVALSAARAGDWIEIRVADQGPGLAPEDLERVMKPYQQAAQETRAPGSGTGLGLPIARELMTLHGGALFLESVLGHGATAVARFPLARARGVDLGPGLDGGLDAETTTQDTPHAAVETA